MRCHCRSAVEGGGDPIGVTFNPLERSGIVVLTKDRRTLTGLKVCG